MKILVISDLHFRVRNSSATDKFIDECLKKCESEQPDAAIFLGDILNDHERLHTVPMNKAATFIGKVQDSCPTFVLVGNHDYLNNQEFLSTNHWMNQMKRWNNTCIVDSCVRLQYSTKNITLVPYVPPGRIIEALNSQPTSYTIAENRLVKIVSDPTNKWDQSDIIFAHQEIYGCKMGAIVSEIGDKWDLESPYLISGHIHDRQNPQPNVYYPGSSMQTSYGDETKPHVLIVQADKYPPSLRTIGLNVPLKKTVTLEAKDFSSFEPQDSSKDVKIIVKGKCEDFKSLKKSKKFQELLRQGYKIVYKPIVELVEEVPNLKTTDFLKVLGNLVEQDGDPNLKIILGMIVK